MSMMPRAWRNETPIDLTHEHNADYVGWTDAPDIWLTADGQEWASQPCTNCEWADTVGLDGPYAHQFIRTTTCPDHT